MTSQFSDSVAPYDGRMADKKHEDTMVKLNLDIAEALRQAVAGSGGCVRRPRLDRLHRNAIRRQYSGAR
jgi:hypothetical protein